MSTESALRKEDVDVSLLHAVSSRLGRAVVYWTAWCVGSLGAALAICALVRSEVAGGHVSGSLVGRLLIAAVVVVLVCHCWERVRLARLSRELYATLYDE